MKKIISIFIIFVSFFTVSYTHSGRTDSNGGHYNRSTGEYHYHHGYPAHSHINGFCPYEADLADLLPNKCSNCNEIVNVENGYYCFECGYDMVSLSGIRVSTVDGQPNKTRSEYFKEVEQLKSEVENLQTELNNKKSTITELNNEISEKENELITLKDNITLGIILCVIIISVVILWKTNPFKMK